MNTANKYQGPANIQSFQTFADASGATAVISYGRYTYSFDLLGEIKCNLLKPVHGSRVENKIALDVCYKAYTALVSTLTPEYVAQNKMLYAVQAWEANPRLQ